ncbi:MAG: trypsin-like peptidase domain-containing protein [Chloroflexota bacterium]|nr:trypsin-like peptidase domain-containing protein [Chloroflexota bacterium]
MQQFSESIFLAYKRGTHWPAIRRGIFASLFIVVLGASLSGCTFLQPDFSNGDTEVETATPAVESSQVRSIAVERESSGDSAAPPAAAASAARGGVEEAEEPGGSTEAIQESDQSTGEPELTETAGSVAAGPLNDILGDNVPEVASPAEEGEGGSKVPSLGLSPLDIVAAQDQVLEEIYNSTLPSVVLIRVSRNLGSLAERPSIPDLPDIPNDFFERTGGTGFVWDDEGHIITNHHVVAQADRVIVVLPNRVEMEAEFLGSDPDSDLAVLKVSDPDGFLVPVTLGDSDEVKMGQLAVAIGNPFGQQFSITTGIISGIGRTIRSGHSQFSIPEVLQTDAPINPGNSGGPLLDRNGHVIGVNTQIISRAGVSSGIGFAVPINIAKQVVPTIISDGEYEYSWLGISGTSLGPDAAKAMDLLPNTRGAMVIDLVTDGPAEEAGLEGSDETIEIEGLEIPYGGDIIVAIDGTPIETIDDVIAYLVARTKPDQEVVFEIIRDGTRQEITVTLGKRPTP